MTVVSIVVAVVALAVAVLALRRADVVERRAKQWLEAAGATPNGAPTVPGSERPAGAVAATGESSTIAELRDRLDRLESPGATAGLSRVAVVRYDAFEDLGGRQSFSAAIVDEAGRGLVLTAIHGRSETRSYLKEVPVPPGGSQRELSPEEQQAVAEARAKPAATAQQSGPSAGRTP